MNGPTRGATERADSWTSRPGAARTLRVLSALVPFAASLAATWVVRRRLPDPTGWAETAIFLATLITTALVTAFVVERASRRLLPLASLLELSLVFPDQAPSRYGAALRSGSTRQLRRKVDEIRSHRFSQDASEATAEILDMVEALRRHEPLTRGHTERVRAYSDLIAEEMKLGAEERWKLQWGVLLHDIGKLEVPAEILNKNGAPTNEEWEVIKGHPAAGAALAEPLAGWLGDAAFAAGQHHEKWDGTGYPNGLAGNEISLAGRIVAVADAYDVITSTRSYKQAMSAEAARRELVASSGTHFDPTVVKAMLQVSVGAGVGRWARHSWLAHIPALFRPGAIAATAASATTAALIGVVGFAPPAEEPVSDAAARIAPITDDAASGDAATPALPATPDSPDSVAAPTSTTAASDDDAPTTTVPDSADATSTTSTPLDDATTTTTSPTSSSTTSTTASPSSTSTTSTTTTTQPPTLCEMLIGGETQLPGADLTGCDLSGRTLDGVDLGGADLRGADLTGATVTNFNLGGASLDGATLNNANLSDGTLAGAGLSDLSAMGLALARVDLAGATLPRANLAGAVITDVSFGFATATNASFANATFSGTNFNDATINDTTFAGASLVGTEFWRTVALRIAVGGADVSLAVFGATNLTGATGTPAATGGASFQGATCPDGLITDPCW